MINWISEICNLVQSKGSAGIWTLAAQLEGRNHNHSTTCHNMASLYIFHIMVYHVFYEAEFLWKPKIIILGLTKCVKKLVVWWSQKVPLGFEPTLPRLKARMITTRLYGRTWPAYTLSFISWCIMYLFGRVFVEVKKMIIDERKWAKKKTKQLTVLEFEFYSLCTGRTQH